MKVLLLQEMSGVHTELKLGLNENKVQANIATLGDYFKKYKTDVSLGRSGGGYFGALNRMVTQLGSIPRIKKFDIIQSISPSPYISFLDNFIDDYLTKDRKKVFVAAGSDPIYLNFVRELDYYPPHIHFDRWTDEERQIQYKKFVKKLHNSYNKIVPVCWEYKFAMQKAGLNPEGVIPFPIDVVKNVPTKKSNNKIKVFHPLNRIDLNYDFKGTLLIQKAFENLEKKYPDVEFISKGNMSHEEYNNYTDEVDIIVDQCYSYSYGMSAAYGLAKGKVVLSGLEEVTKEEAHYAECPIINIKPNVSSIEEELDQLLQNRERIFLLSGESRSFAEKYHDSTKVAKKYIELYQSI